MNLMKVILENEDEIMGFSLENKFQNLLKNLKLIKGKVV